MFKLLLLIPITFSLNVFAGSSTVDCFTQSHAMMFSVGNGSNTIQIKYKEKGSDLLYEAPIMLMPDFDYNTEINKKTMSALPVSNKKIISEENLVMHVIHQDGTSCYGRESWSTYYTQRLLLTGKDGSSLKMVDELANKEIENMNDDGYVVGEFSCHAFGITTAGGCYDEDGDTVVWEKQ